MKKMLSSDETSLVGSWVMKDGNMVQDTICKRIQWLTNSYLEEITVDGDNWSALYKNPDDGSYWELTYPQSHMHGGGPPAFQRISGDDACRQYSL